MLNILLYTGGNGILVAGGILIGIFLVGGFLTEGVGKLFNKKDEEIPEYVYWIFFLIVAAIVLYLL